MGQLFDVFKKKQESTVASSPSSSVSVSPPGSVEEKLHALTHKIFNLPESWHDPQTPRAFDWRGVELDENGDLSALRLAGAKIGGEFTGCFPSSLRTLDLNSQQLNSFDLRSLPRKVEIFHLVSFTVFNEEGTTGVGGRLEDLFAALPAARSIHVAGCHFRGMLETASLPPYLEHLALGTLGMCSPPTIKLENVPDLTSLPFQMVTLRLDNQSLPPPPLSVGFHVLDLNHLPVTFRQLHVGDGNGEIRYRLSALAKLPIEVSNQSPWWWRLKRDLDSGSVKLVD